MSSNSNKKTPKTPRQSGTPGSPSKAVRFVGPADSGSNRGNPSSHDPGNQPSFSRRPYDGFASLNTQPKPNRPSQTPKRPTPPVQSKITLPPTPNTIFTTGERVFTSTDKDNEISMLTDDEPQSAKPGQDNELAAYDLKTPSLSTGPTKKITENDVTKALQSMLNITDKPKVLLRTPPKIMLTVDEVESKQNTPKSTEQKTSFEAVNAERAIKKRALAAILRKITLEWHEKLTPGVFEGPPVLLEQRTPMNPTDFEWVLANRSRSMSRYITHYIRIWMHELTDTSDYNINQFIRDMMNELDDAPAYYRNFMHVMNRLYDMYTTAAIWLTIVADELYQLPLDNTIRRYVALLFIFDENLIYLSAAIPGYEYDPRLATRMIERGFETHEVLRNNILDVVVNDSDINPRDVSSPEIMLALVGLTAYQMSRRYRGFPNPDRVARLATNYLDYLWDDNLGRYTADWLLPSGWCVRKKAVTPLNIPVSMTTTDTLQVTPTTDVDDNVSEGCASDQARASDNEDFNSDFEAETRKATPVEKEPTTARKSDQSQETQTTASLTEQPEDVPVSTEEEYTHKKSATKNKPISRKKILRISRPAISTTRCNVGSSGRAPTPPWLSTPQLGSKPLLELKEEPTHTTRRVIRLRDDVAQMSTVRRSIRRVLGVERDEGNLNSLDLAQAVPFEDEDLDVESFRKKYGDHSVHAVGTFDSSYQPMYQGAIQTIMQVTVPTVRGNMMNYDYVEDDRSLYLRIGTRLRLPMWRHPAACMVVAEDLHVFIPKADALNRFKVSIDSARIRQHNFLLPPFIDAGRNTASIKQLSNALNEVSGAMPRVTVEYLAFLVATYCDQHSYLSFFTLGWMIVMMLIDFEEAGVEPQFDNLIADDITIFRLDNNDPATNHNLASAALAQQRYFLLGDEANAVAMNCMRVMAGGTQGINTPNDFGQQHVLSAVHWAETPRFAVLRRPGDRPQIPNDPRVNAHQMQTFLHNIARTAGRQDELAKGFVRACCMSIVKVKRVKKDMKSKPTSFLVNSMSEVTGTNMPGFAGDNWIWQVLNLFAPVPEATAFLPEVQSISNLLNREMRYTSLSIAATISLGYAHVFQTFNLTGTNLSHCYRNDAAGRARDIVMNLSVVTAQNGIPNISRAACNWVAHASEMVVSQDAFVSARWSGQALTLALEDPIHTWRHLAPETIFYLIQPTAAMCVGLDFDSAWGYTQPGAKANFLRELIEIGDGRYAWYAHEGCSTYRERAATQSPYLYVPYGAMALNAMMQEARRTIDNIRFTVFDHAIGGDRPFRGPIVRPINANVIINNVLFFIRAGSIITYDWRNATVLAPSIIREEQADEIVAVMELEEETLLHAAGLATPATKTRANINTDLDYAAKVSGASRTDVTSVPADVNHPPPKQATVPSVQSDVPVDGHPPKSGGLDPAIQAAAEVVGNSNVSQPA